MTDNQIIKDRLEVCTVESIKSDGGFYTTCPLCNKKGKLEVNKSRSLWFCHRCQTGGRIKGSGPLIKDRDDPTPVDNYQNYEEFLQWYKPCLSGHSIYWEYLLRRGFSGEQIHNLLQPYTGPSYFRVYLPYYMPFDPRPCYFAARDIVDGSTIKWTYPPNGEAPCSKSQVLWGINRITPGLKNLVLCEGIFDAVWKSNRVAMGGKKLSPDQQELIQRIDPEEVTVMLDGDAQLEAVELAASLSTWFFGAVFVVDTPTNKDPGDLREQGEIYATKYRRRIT